MVRNETKWPCAAAALAATLLFGGCGGGSRPVDEADEDHQGPLAPGDVAVATVDGVPIGAARVAALARETGRSPREVLDRLIDFELLAAEARRRGLSSGAEVRHVERQAMVQRYLQERFEATHRPQDIPDALTRRAYERLKRRFVHPKLYHVAHIHVWAVEKEVSPAKRRAAHALAAEIARKARGVEDLDAFLELGRSYNGRQGFKVDAAQVAGAVHEHSGQHASFRAATLKLQHPGDVSGPVDTIFGTHVIYLIETRAPSNKSYESVREKIQQVVHARWLEQEFLRLTEELRDATTVTGFVGERRRPGDR